MSLIQSYRKKIEDRIANRDDAFLAVIGPCSIYNEEETLEYEAKVKELQKELGDSIFLVMRAFVEKSRTSHSWRGFVYQPDMSGEENILEGIRRSKNLFSQMTTPLAMEFIDPAIYPHLAPFISWGFIGARTARSTTHRVLVSNSAIPFGFKNSLDGDVTAAIQSCVISKHPHCILNGEGQSFTSGNPNTHVVLRGGQNGINYDEDTVEYLNILSKKYGTNAPVLIDCSHGNCPDKPRDQKTAFTASLDLYLENPKNILGVMVESNLVSGASPANKIPGVSITDPCLSFEATKELLLYAKAKISRKCTLV